jgi:hypothetical protein
MLNLRLPTGKRRMPRTSGDMAPAGKPDDSQRLAHLNIRLAMPGLIPGYGTCVPGRLRPIPYRHRPLSPSKLTLEGECLGDGG